jgi:hypothetical protein
VCLFQASPAFTLPAGVIDFRPGSGVRPAVSARHPWVRATTPSRATERCKLTDHACQVVPESPEGDACGRCRRESTDPVAELCAKECGRVKRWNPLRGSNHEFPDRQRWLLQPQLAPNPGRQLDPGSIGCASQGGVIALRQAHVQQPGLSPLSRNRWPTYSFGIIIAHTSSLTHYLR